MRFARRIFGLVGLALLCGCVVTPPSQAITGGTASARIAAASAADPLHPLEAGCASGRTPGQTGPSLRDARMVITQPTADNKLTSTHITVEGCINIPASLPTDIFLKEHFVDVALYPTVFDNSGHFVGSEGVGVYHLPLHRAVIGSVPAEAPGMGDFLVVVPVEIDARIKLDDTQILRQILFRLLVAPCNDESGKTCFPDRNSTTWWILTACTTTNSQPGVASGLCFTTKP